jgi:hypothetical protein
VPSVHGQGDSRIETRVYRQPIGGGQRDEANCENSIYTLDRQRFEVILGVLLGVVYIDVSHLVFPSSSRLFSD